MLHNDDGAWSPSGGFNNWGVYTDTTYRRDGVFYQNSKIKMVTVTDGTSNTVAIGERIRLITNPSLYPEGQDEYGTWALGTAFAENHMESALGCIGIPLNYNYTASTSTYNRFPASNTAGAFSSSHTSKIVGFAFLDGTVRFLDNSTSDSVRLALGTIMGGESVSLP
jgi:hypothetical protein